MYIICPYFVHSLIEFHFYAFYSSLSLKQAVVWRARMEKHNHGALWLIMDLHNSLWISTDDLWISIIEFWASIIGFMEIHYSNYGAPYHSIYEDPPFDSWSSTIYSYGALNDLWRSIIHMMKLHDIHIIWSSMIEMSTEFHNKYGSSIIMIFVFSDTLCDYGKVKRTEAYRLLNHVVFDCKK